MASRRDTHLTPEWRLLLACAGSRPAPESAAAIGQSVLEPIDWTRFVQLAADHDLAALAGHALNCTVPDRVPEDILDAFRATIESTRRRNRALLFELARITDALKSVGVEAIPIRGPVLVQQAYGDPGLRIARGLDLLVRDSALAATLAAVSRLGYRRKSQLTAAQLDLIGRIEGCETLLSKTREIALTVHTRLAPLTIRLDVDYAALWRRARRTPCEGRMALTLAPDDHFLLLAIHGGKELWRRVAWAADMAAFLASHPNLDWAAIRERARAQGSDRMVLLATALAREFFGAVIPDAAAPAGRDGRAVGEMVERILSGWLGAEAGGAPRDSAPAMDRIRLQDRTAPRLAYVARTLLLPSPHHVARIRLPERFTSLAAYVPLALAQNLVLLPLLRAYRAARAWQPFTGDKRRRSRLHRAARAEAMGALTANPNDPGAWHRLGNAQAGLRRYQEAIACYDKALAVLPDNIALWKDRSAAARAGGSAAAPSGIEDERMLDPQDGEGWTRRAGFLAASQRFAEAAAASDRALAVDPTNLRALRIGIRARITTCDWHKRADDKRCVSEALRAGLPIVPPFDHRAICESEAEHLIAARLFARNFPRAKPLWQGETYRHERIRIAYLSSEFKRHATAALIAGVFEHHDRTRFETVACSYGADDGSTLRRRIEAAMDRFVDVRTLSDAEVAARLRAMEIDIAIDLNGNAGAGRAGILAHRPSPVQVNYLGNAGTMGVSFLDYMIADRTVIPIDEFAHYSEKIVHLPHSYQCNDSRRMLPQHAPSRIEAGLPEEGFVFCCFNKTYKIAPEVFGIWMRLLSAHPGSVLWLLGDNPHSMHNLRLEAAAAGVVPERLLFARIRPEEDHLARLRLADLFLDTLPVNGHATASDALWAGLPVLTCLGRTFGGRVAASVLRALGLPELVTSSLAEYEELAHALTRDHARLAALKSKLERNRNTEPLFDTARYTRGLESAYAAMAERSRRGEPPESFSVADG